MPILLATYCTNKLIDTKRYVSETKKETINRSMHTNSHTEKKKGGKRGTLEEHCNGVQMAQSLMYGKW